MAQLLDALESDGKVTALVATGIGSFILLQGAENGRLESQQWVHSQALAMTLNSGDGIVRLISPHEIVFRPPTFTESVTAMIMPDGELHVDGKLFWPSGGPLKVGSGASQSGTATPDGPATGTGKGAQTQTSAPVPAPEARARKEIVRRINGGIIKEVQTHKDAEHYVATLYWMPDGGVPVVIDRSERSLKFDPHWTLRAGYFEGNRIALWRTKATGMTEYWGFTEKEGRWQLTDRAFLGTTSGEGFDNAQFTSVRRLEFLNGNKVSVRFEITEQPRSGDAVYRKVIRNGVEWAAPGTFVGTETEESLAALAAKSSPHGELLLIIKGGMIVQTREPKGGDRYVTTLYWQVDGGDRVVVDQSEQSANEEMRWTLDAGYFDGENIALWRGNAGGMTEYWCYTKQKDSKWKLTKRAQLGSFAGTGIDDARFNSLRAIELLKGDVVKVRFAVTDTPRGGDPVYRKVLRNGVEWAPKGSAIGTELQDLAEVQKRKTGMVPSDQHQPNNRSRLPWVAGGVVVLLGVGWLLWKVVRR
ncbi:hypothetical protein [Verrucomicrobium spinosum]|uniref:hypothetical protein n=1 Tax=Verrucomicrobium spinosum TaxID=2736 RepID=UPI0009467F92|nr:hypothetical protein [Verrucomicrobium spinosum]